MLDRSAFQACPGGKLVARLLSNIYPAHGHQVGKCGKDRLSQCCPIDVGLHTCWASVVSSASQAELVKVQCGLLKEQDSTCMCLAQHDLESLLTVTTLVGLVMSSCTILPSKIHAV